VIARTLALRRACPSLFAAGSYEPLEVQGSCADRVIAFARRLGDQVAVTIVPRIASRLLRSKQDLVFDARAWADTVIASDAGELSNLFAGTAAADGPIKVGAILSAFPIALLVSPAVAEVLARGYVAAHTTSR